MPSEKIVRCLLPSCSAFIDVRKIDPKELVVGKDIDDFGLNLNSYYENVVKMCLASPEPSLHSYGSRLEMVNAVYSLCLRVNPWMKIDEVKLVVRKPSEKQTKRKVPSLCAVIGQDKAVKAISEILERAEAGIGDPNRPLSTLLLMGPTGVGKTMMAKKMAEVLVLPLVRIDCSEYGSEHEYAKLIGAPPGYVGYDNGGRFDTVLDKIHETGVVLLWDEIEKASRKVHDLILHVLDEGRFTTGNNKEIDFRKCYIVMTSNLGSEGVEALRNRAGFQARSVSQSEMEESFRIAIKAEFRPEFVNRLDEVIVFHSLSYEDAEEITSGLLRDLGRRIRSRYHVRVVFSQSVKKRVLETGFSSEYGARELRRAIKKGVESCLARMLSGAKVGSTITMNYKDGVFSCDTSTSASA